MGARYSHPRPWPIILLEMVGFQLLILITVVLIVLGAIELALHRRQLTKVPIRIHVNGTRGKTSVTRLIGAGLREGGLRTCAKTTGTLARMILPNGRELPIYRPAGANIMEQRRIVAVAAAHKAEVLVIECMALQPLLQSLSELKLINASHAVITNARPDHLEVMGPDEENVARALAGTVPVGGKLYTSEKKQLEIFREAASDRGTTLIEVEPTAQDREDTLRLPYTGQAENLALAVRVCADLGVERQMALTGMWKARPDPGAMTEREIDFFGRRIVFVNGFAANDPVSSEQLWELAVKRHEDVNRRIAVFNCRADRPDRSVQLGRAFPQWSQADHVLLMGTGTYLLARAAEAAGFDAGRLLFAEQLSVEEVFERVVELIEDSALVMGMGNTGGSGLALAQYFGNRAAPEKK